MKRKIFILTILMSLPAFIASADQGMSPDVAKLMQAIDQLRADYQTQISALQAQVKMLQKNQAQDVEQLERKIKKGFEVDYVGRDHDAFGKGGLEVAHGSGNAKVTLGGYIDHEFENFENNNSTFDQHRWIINVGAEIGERLRFFSEYEIEHGGPDANNAGDGSAKVEQAYVDYLITDAINVRGGAVLAPFGRYNIYHDSDLNDLTDRPLVNRDIIPTTWTEAGVGFFGDLDLTEDIVVSYEGYIVNGLDDGFSDTGNRAGRGSLRSDNNNNKAVVGRVVVSPGIGHEFGFSGYHGAYDNAGNDIGGFAFDWITTWGPLELIGEFAYFDIDSNGGARPDDMRGMYVQANYHFWPEFLDDTFLGKTFENPTFTLVGRYGFAEIADDNDAGTGDNEETRYTIGLNYRPVESWVFKLEYQFNDTNNEALERGDNNGFMGSFAMGF